MSDTVIRFPERLGVKSPREQFEELKRMSSAELLSALVTKYPNITFTADELRSAKGNRVRVKAIGRNEWTIEPTTEQQGESK
jgi:hypothetical protein